MSARPIITTPAVPWILSADGIDTPIVGSDLLDGHAVPNITVIAHSLSLINRYTGHTLRPYSVAEHSLLVCDIVAAAGLDCHAQMLALLHDAHECLCGDVTAPVKRALGMRWRELESTLSVAVLNAFGLRDAYRTHHRAVHHADMRALATERAHLTLFCRTKNAPWPEIDDPEAPIRAVDDSYLMRHTRGDWQPMNWCNAFLTRFAHLKKACDASAAAPQNTAETPAT